MIAIKKPAFIVLVGLLLAAPGLTQTNGADDVPVVTSPLLLIDDVNPQWPVDETPKQVRLVPFEMDDEQKKSLTAAPSLVLNGRPSDTLRNAIERDWLRHMRADRATGEGVDVLQGYLYYLAAPGQYLEVLCVSQPTFPVVWTHCQEEGIGPLEGF